MASRFRTIDYVVFAVSLVGSVAVGLYFSFSGDKPVTNNQYLVGGRNLGVIPVTISLVVSFVSTIGILGNPAEVYVYGTQYIWYLLATCAGIIVGTLLFVPLYYPLKLTSIYEYTKMRYNTKYLEYAGIAMDIMNMLLFSSILIYSPCLAFQGVSGFPAWISIIICGAIATMYTVLGGMKAVVWTDVFQASVIIVALLAIVIKGTMEVGSVSEVWQINQQWDRVTSPNFSLDPTVRLSFWSVCVIHTLTWIAMVTSQPSVQRFMSMPSMTKAKLSTVLIVPGFLASGLLTCMAGLTAFAYYAKKGCDPITSGMLPNINQILPFFVMTVLNIPTLPGLFIASLFSASLSSISSMYSGMGAIAWQNVLKPRFSHLASRTQANITKLCTLGFGVLSIILAFIMMSLGGTLIQITYGLVSMTVGPVLGIALIGATLPKVGGKVTMIAVLVALFVSGWLGIGAALNRVVDPPLPGPVYNCTFVRPPATQNSNLTADGETTTSRRNWFYSISYFWYPFISILIMYFICGLASKLGVMKPAVETQKKYIFPFLRKYWGMPDVDEPEEEKPKPKELETPQKMANGDSQPKGEDRSRDADADVSRDLVWERRVDVRLLSEINEFYA